MEGTQGVGWTSAQASAMLKFCPSSSWWHIPLISVIRKFRQEDQETEVILCYIVMLRLAWAT